MKRKYFHIYFPDKVAIVAVNVKHPVCKIWPTSKKAREILHAKTYKEVSKLAKQEMRTISQFILYKICKHFNLL